MVAPAGDVTSVSDGRGAAVRHMVVAPAGDVPSSGNGTSEVGLGGDPRRGHISA